MTTNQNTTRATAADVQPGMTLHRVDPVSPRSAVFDRPIDAEVLEVRDDVYPGYITISLVPVAPAHSHTLNLPPDRGVTLAEGA